MHASLTTEVGRHSLSEAGRQSLTEAGDTRYARIPRSASIPRSADIPDWPACGRSPMAQTSRPVRQR